MALCVFFMPILFGLGNGSKLKCVEFFLDVKHIDFLGFSLYFSAIITNATNGAFDA